MGLLSNESGRFSRPVIRPTSLRPRSRSRQPATSRRLTKLNGEQRSRLITRYREGRSIPQLTQEFGAHGQTIRELLLDAGEDVKTSMSRSLTEAQIAQAVRLRAGGATVAEAARVVGGSESSVRRALKIKGL